MVSRANECRKVWTNSLIWKEEKPLIELVVNDPLDNEIKITPPDELNNIELSNYYCLLIKDNGIGIPKKIKNRVFDPFFTTKKIGEGTGMGLAMVYGTIVNHQGWVQLLSKDGVGTTFYIFLPRDLKSNQKEQSSLKISEQLQNAKLA